MMKQFSRLLVAVLIAALAFTAFGCANEEEAPAAAQSAPAAPTETRTAAPAGDYEDGIYFAREDGFGSSGWKSVATVVVEDGKIVDADWNGAHMSAGYDKKKVAKDGDYNMVAFGNAQAEWDVQAERAEAYLLEVQDPTAIAYTDDEGHTDDIAGVSIHVAGFFDLVERALEAGPAALGPYEDGVYHAEADEFASSGWKGTVDMTVYNGRIMAVNWSAVNEAGEDKKEASINGDYGMVAKGGAQAEWHEQAYAAEAFLLETQDPAAITYNADGYTDAISGVSVHVSEFAALVEKALEAGPVEN
jgi:major membrane immunogen (membrane-anchored lipoprotein)